jgi:hypothetical protein
LSAERQVEVHKDTILRQWFERQEGAQLGQAGAS